jgi:N-ethylmaleimide reductase
MSESLFIPGKIGAIRVRSRIAMAPLTRARAGMDDVRRRWR